MAGFEEFTFFGMHDSKWQDGTDNDMNTSVERTKCLRGENFESVRVNDTFHPVDLFKGESADGDGLPPHARAVSHVRCVGRTGRTAFTSVRQVPETRLVARRVTSKPVL